MASASFTIEGGASPQSVAASATVDLALSSVTGARLIEWSIVGGSDSAVSTPTITPAGTPSGATATFNVGTESVAGLGLSWIVQCRINGGVDDTGAAVSSFTSTGIVGIENSGGILPFAVGEKFERNATHGIADDLNAAISVASVGGSVTMGGDVTGSSAACTVGKVKGTTITTAGGALAVGAVLRTTAVGTADWGQVNLADTDAVTGTLPAGNQASQSMGGDCSGTTASCTVAKVNGTTYGAGGSLTTGQVPRVTGASTTAYGALDLANASAVTGVLPAANVDPAASGSPVATPVTLTFNTSNGTADATAFTVPASPSGNNRFVLTRLVLRFSTAITGGGNVVLRAGTTTGGNELLIDSAAYTSGTGTAGVVYGSLIADAGASMPSSTGYEAFLNASDTVNVRATTAGGGISGGALKAHVYGYFVPA